MLYESYFIPHMEEKVEASKHLPPSLSTSLVSATSPNIPCAACHDRMGQVLEANQKATSLKMPSPLTVLATQHPVICAVLSSDTRAAPPDEMDQASRANCKRAYTQVSVLLDGIKYQSLFLHQLLIRKCHQQSQYPPRLLLQLLALQHH